MVDQIVNSAEEAAGIESPSKVAAEIGRNIGAGLVMGIEESAAGVEEAMAALFDAGGALSGFGSSFVRSYQEMTLRPLEDSLDGINEQIRELEASGGGFGGPGGLPTVEARKLAELYQAQAAANEEIAGAQERIVELQRQQSQFEFLEQQMELLQFLRESGLDPADILGGIELGLNASLPDLIDAMSTAMQAIIAQAEEDLGIASPSSVFKSLMREVGTGSVLGLDEARQMIGQKATSLADELFRPLGVRGMDDIMEFARKRPAGAGSNVDNRRSLALYGDVVLPGVTDGPSFLEELEAMAG